MNKIIKLLLVFFAVMLIQMRTFAQNVKFLQVTDVHMTQNNAHNLEDFVNDINRKYNDLDFVIFTGDNIDQANVNDLKTFLSIIKKLKFKQYVVLGNHDVYKNKGLDKKKYMKMVRQELGEYHSDKPNYVFKDKGVVVMVMDGVKEVIPGPGGYYKEDELDWLDKNLTKYKKYKVVIVQHFPLLAGKAPRNEAYRREDYLEMLKNHDNVLAVVCGHYHENREEMKDNIYHVLTMKWLNNSYYKIIEIDTDLPMVYTQLIDNNEN